MRFSSIPYTLQRLHCIDVPVGLYIECSRETKWKQGFQSLRLQVGAIRPSFGISHDGTCNPSSGLHIDPTGIRYDDGNAQGCYESKESSPFFKMKWQCVICYLTAYTVNECGG